MSGCDLFGALGLLALGTAIRWATQSFWIANYQRRQQRHDEYRDLSLSLIKSAKPFSYGSRT